VGQGHPHPLFGRAAVPHFKTGKNDYSGSGTIHFAAAMASPRSRPDDWRRLRKCSKIAPIGSRLRRIVAPVI